MCLGQHSLINFVSRFANLTKLRLNRLLDPRVQRYFQQELQKNKAQDELEASDLGGSSNFDTVLLILQLQL